VTEGIFHLVPSVAQMIQPSTNGILRRGNRKIDFGPRSAAILATFALSTSRLACIHSYCFAKEK